MQMDINFNKKLFWNKKPARTTVPGNAGQSVAIVTIPL